MPTLSVEKHLQTQLAEFHRLYDAITRRIAALDTDIGCETDSERRLSFLDRRVALCAERNWVVKEMEGLEQRLSGIQVLASPPPPDTFVGRDYILYQLSGLLLPDDQSVVAAAIIGIPGVGKTTLAKKLGRTLAPKFPGGVLWLDVGIGAEVDPICRQLSLKLGFDPVHDLPANDVLQAALRIRGRMLIILDDIWDVSMGRWIIKNLVPDDHVLLITTRHQDVARSLCHHVVTLQKLSVEQSLELLTKTLGTIEEHVLVARDVVTMLYGLPLALEIATRLCVLGVQDLPWIKERLEANSLLDEIRLEGEEYRDTSLRACLDLSYEYLDADSKLCFRALGAFCPTPFDLRALAVVWGQRDLARAEVQARQLVQLGLLEQIGMWIPGVLKDHPIPIYQQHDLLWRYARSLAPWDEGLDKDLGEGLAKDLVNWKKRHGWHYHGVVQGGTDKGGWRWWPQVIHAYQEFFFTNLASFDEKVQFVCDIERFSRGRD